MYRQIDSIHCKRILTHQDSSCIAELSEVTSCVRLWTGKMYGGDGLSCHMFNLTLTTICTWIQNEFLPCFNLEEKKAPCPGFKYKVAGDQEYAVGFDSSPHLPWSLCPHVIPNASLAHHLWAHHASVFQTLWLWLLIQQDSGPALAQTIEHVVILAPA